MATGKWSGLAEAIQSVQDLGHELGDQKILLPVLKQEAKPLLEDIQRRLPDDPRTSERLADDWIMTADADAQGNAMVRVGPRTGRGSTSYKSWFFERGTSKMAARPSARPAWDNFAPGFPARAAAALREKAAAVISRLAKRALR